MIDDRYPSGIILRGPGLAFNTPALVDRVPAFAEVGFDSMSISYLLRSNHVTPEAAAEAHFPRGKQIDGANLWVANATARWRHRGLFEIDVEARGRIGGIRYHRKVDAVTQQSGGSDIAITTPAGYPFTYPAVAASLRTNEPALVCVVSYVSTSAPDYSKVGRTTNYAGNPLPAGYPELPAGPSNLWVSIAEPTWIFPAGWILEARRADPLKNAAGAEVCWFIEDIFTYYHPAVPG